MGNGAALRPLAVWLYGTPVAHLEAVDDRARLTWTAQAAERWGLGARVMSELLPVQRAGESPHDRRVMAFLAGLLVEGNLREHLAIEAGVTSDDIFGWWPRTAATPQAHSSSCRRTSLRPTISDTTKPSRTR